MTSKTFLGAKGREPELILAELERRQAKGEDGLIEFLHEETGKSNPQYYYRPWKTILVRTVADGGESFYFCGDHRATLPQLHHLLLRAK